MTRTLLLVGLAFCALSCGQQPPATSPTTPAPASAQEASPEAEPFRFVLASDSHAVVQEGDQGVAINQEFLKQIDFLNEVPGDFVVVNGDVVDGYAEPEVLRKMWAKFGDVEKQLKKRLVLVPGNHDVYDAESEQIWRQRNGAPYRSFDHKGAHFVILDSEDQAAPQTIDGKQLAWLENDLAEETAPGRTFVFLHRPLWVEDAEHWKDKVQPLLARHGVDTVFAGHWHSYRQCPTEQGVKYVIASSIGGAIERIGGFSSVLPVEVGPSESHHVVLRPDGQELPADVVRFDWLELTENAVARLPARAGSDGKGIVLPLAIENPLEVPIEGHASLQSEGTQWEAANAEFSVAPGAKRTIELGTSYKGKLSPLPTIAVDLTAGRSLLEKKSFVADVSEMPWVTTRTLDDFEDETGPNSAKTNGIAAMNGGWFAAADELGSRTKLSYAETMRDSSKTRALHVAGYHCRSDNDNQKYCWSVLGTLLGQAHHGADLGKSIGVTFRARGAHTHSVWFAAEGTINSVRTNETGAGHRVDFHPAEEWTTYTFYWQEFEQPHWACPGNACTQSPLTVDNIEQFSWAFRDEDHDFDLWLDDIELIYPEAR